MLTVGREHRGDVERRFRARQLRHLAGCEGLEEHTAPSLYQLGERHPPAVRRPRGRQGRLPVRRQRPRAEAVAVHLPDPAALDEEHPRRRDAGRAGGPPGDLVRQHVHGEPEIRVGGGRQRRALLVGEDRAADVVQPGRDLAALVQQLDRELGAEGLVEPVVHRPRGGAAGRVADRDHLEPVAVVEVAPDDGAYRVEPGARDHHQPRPRAWRIVDADPDALVGLGRVLGLGRPGQRQGGESGKTGR